MTSTVDIINAINLLVVKGLPEYKIPPVDEIVEVLIDIKPKDFERPALLIQTVDTGGKDANRGHLHITEYFTLTVIDGIDDYQRTSTISLLGIRQKVMDLFRTGFLQVGDRSIKLKASSGGRNWNEAYIDLELEFFDRRVPEPDPLPLMEELVTNMNPNGDD